MCASMSVCLCEDECECHLRRFPVSNRDSKTKVMSDAEPEYLGSEIPHSWAQASVYADICTQMLIYMHTKC